MGANNAGQIMIVHPSISRRTALALERAALASGFPGPGEAAGKHFVSANNSAYDTLDPHVAFDIGRIPICCPAPPSTVYTFLMPSRSPRPIPPHPDVVIEAQERAWSGRFAVDVIRFRHRRFDGAMSPPRSWELWRRGRAVALVPYDPVTDTVVLIEQFRLPALAAGIEPVLVELPAGLVEDGEDPIDAMHRELHEEMRMTADRLERIGAFLLTAGGSDELLDLYVGRVSAPKTGPDGIVGHAGAEMEGEDIRTRVWPADKAIALALDGGTPNSVIAIGLLWLAAKRDTLREQWSKP
jgi:ADP-ribose pyrophosphatase